jgi:hypothetical protein
MLAENFDRQAQNNSLSHPAGQLIPLRWLSAVQPSGGGIDFSPKKMQIYQKV